MPEPVLLHGGTGLMYRSAERWREKEYIPFLLGTGIRILNVDPPFLPGVQETVMGLNVKDAKSYVEKMVAQTSIKGARAVMASWGKQGSGF